MGRQITFLRKCLDTKITFKLFFSHVSLYMDRQMIFLKKCLDTKIAPERFFSNMTSFMIIQLTMISKALITQITLRGAIKETVKVGNSSQQAGSTRITTS